MAAARWTGQVTCAREHAVELGRLHAQYLAEAGSTETELPVPDRIPQLARLAARDLRAALDTLAQDLAADDLRRPLTPFEVTLWHFPIAADASEMAAFFQRKGRRHASAHLRSCLRAAQTYGEVVPGGGYPEPLRDRNPLAELAAASGSAQLGARPVRLTSGAGAVQAAPATPPGADRVVAVHLIGAAISRVDVTTVVRHWLTLTVHTLDATRERYDMPPPA